jgi:hypothetical protein
MPWYICMFDSFSLAVDKASNNSVTIIGVEMSSLGSHNYKSKNHSWSVSEKYTTTVRSI